MKALKVPILQRTKERDKEQGPDQPRIIQVTSRGNEETCLEGKQADRRFEKQENRKIAEKTVAVEEDVLTPIAEQDTQVSLPQFK